MKTTRELVMAISFFGLLGYVVATQQIGCHGEPESPVGWWVSQVLFTVTLTVALGIIVAHASDAIRHLHNRWISP